VFFAGVATADAVLVTAVTALPAAGWAAFFWILKTNRRMAVGAAFIFAIVPRAIYVAAAAPSRGWSSMFVPALVTVAWGGFLIALFCGWKVRWLALILLPLTTLAMLEDVLVILSSLNGLASGSLIFFLRSNPFRAVWRQMLTPAILAFYWITQFRFLLAVKADE